MYISVCLRIIQLDGQSSSHSHSQEFSQHSSHGTNTFSNIKSITYIKPKTLRGYASNLSRDGKSCVTLQTDQTWQLHSLIQQSLPDILLKNSHFEISPLSSGHWYCLPEAEACVPLEEGSQVLNTLASSVGAGPTTKLNHGIRSWVIFLREVQLNCCSAAFRPRFI